MMRIRLAMALAAAVLMTGCDYDGEGWGSSTRFKEEFSETHTLAPGGRVFLENFNGSVEVLGWDRDAVEVTGSKYASRREVMEEMKIEVVSSSDSLRIRTIRPAVRNCNCGAKYVLRLPRQAMLERIETSNGSLRVEAMRGEARLRTSNGSLKVTDFQGPLEATTSNGTVEVMDYEGNATLKTSNGRIRANGLKGRIDATTSNGSIDMTVTEPAPGLPMKLTTSNGSINLTLDKWAGAGLVARTSNSSINVRLPEGVNAQLQASTSNGSINTEMEIATTQMSKTRVDGRIGTGGPLIDLATSNGSIRVLRR
ncbi:MAG: DUF4097 family beta strand repeat protein [Bryobacteraceae bacterium]|nr:DUF4097 family beta strand repeat protein [Bryobacteraceae bacterium]